MRKECKHQNTFEIHGHASDMFSWSINGEGWSEPNYAPHIEGLCGGDDIELEICLECHQVLGFSSEDVKTLIEEQKALKDNFDEFEEE